MLIWNCVQNILPTASRYDCMIKQISFLYILNVLAIYVKNTKYIICTLLLCSFTHTCSVMNRTSKSLKMLSQRKATAKYGLCKSEIIPWMKKNYSGCPVFRSLLVLANNMKIFSVLKFPALHPTVSLICERN